MSPGDSDCETINPRLMRGAEFTKTETFKRHFKSSQDRVKILFFFILEWSVCIELIHNWDLYLSDETRLIQGVCTNLHLTIISECVGEGANTYTSL